MTGQSAVDFVNVATSARRVEQHNPALWAARRALESEEALSQSHRALALLTIPMITRDPDVGWLKTSQVNRSDGGISTHTQPADGLSDTAYEDTLAPMA